MSKVTGIHKNSEVVAKIEEWLKLAREGKLTEIFAAVTIDDSMSYDSSPDVVEIVEVLGILEFIKLSVFENITIQDDEE